LPDLSRLTPLVVLALASVAGWLAYRHFLDTPRALWWSCTHDRNAHYCQGLSFGLSIRNADIPQFVREFDGARVWGPLHGLLQGAVLAVGGPDYRLAVIPSLTAWVLAALFAFLAARRAAGPGRTVAGLAAALFVLSSPAHQAFATDIMIESLGACLSLMVLYLYLVAVQERSPWPGRCLGLALTALFTLKYNYFLLTVFALVASELSRRPGYYVALFRRTLAAVPWSAWLGAQIRRPTSYALALLLAVIAWVVLAGGGTTWILGREVSVTSPHNPIHVLYVLVFLRGVGWWRQAGRNWVQGLGARTGQLVYWHVWPVSVWFLWPKRLSYCLWFVSPANAGEHPHRDLFGGYPFYLNWLAHDYHQGLWALGLIVALVGAAVLTARRFRPGGRVFLWFVLIAAILTVHHPNRKSRFLHSWVAGTWVVAGVGLAHIMFGRLTAARASARPWLAATAVGGLTAAWLPGVLAGGHAPEGGPHPLHPSTLDLTDSYLPELTGARHVAVLSNMPLKHLARWTLMQQAGRNLEIETELKARPTQSPKEGQQRIEAWLQATRSEAIVLVDISPGGHFWEKTPLPCPDYDPLVKVLAGRADFPLVRRWDFPQYGCTITMWRRAGETARQAGTLQAPGLLAAAQRTGSMTPIR
jgi:hypothetical protein